MRLSAALAPRAKSIECKPRLRASTYRSRATSRRPGLLDGNDVVLAGETAFVGVGARGNELGRERFRAARTARTAIESVEVKLADGVPALRAVAGAVATDTIVLGAEKVDAAAFAGFRTIRARARRRAGRRRARVLANATCWPTFAIAPRFRRCGAPGITVEAIDLYEFTKLGITPSMLATRRCGASKRRQCESPSSPTFTVISSALDACLADLESQGGADAIVVAGDLCLDGPKPKKVLQRLEEIGAACMRGNTDRYLSEETSDEKFEPAERRRSPGRGARSASDGCRG